jgi:hypothetical protein
MGYAMTETKEASETYRLVPHAVNNVTFYILEIDSWCHAGVLILNSKEDAEKLIKRDNKYTHLTEANDWVRTRLVEMMMTSLDNPFKHHIASRLCDRRTFFNMLDRAM